MQKWTYRQKKTYTCTNCQ